MQKVTEKNVRGGRREGAGRPSGRNDVGSITIRIPRDVEKILVKQENKTAYILEAIRAYDKEKPKRTIIGFEISYTKEDN